MFLTSRPVGGAVTGPSDKKRSEVLLLHHNCLSLSPGGDNDRQLCVLSSRLILSKPRGRHYLVP